MQGGLDLVGDVTRMSGKVVLVGFHQGRARTVPLGHWNWMAYDLSNAHFREVATIMRGMDVGARLLAAGRSSVAAGHPPVWPCRHRGGFPGGGQQARRLREGRSWLCGLRRTR